MPTSNDSRLARRKKHSPFFKISMWIIGILLVLFISGLGLFAYYAKSAPSISENQLKSGSASVVYDADNHVIKTLGTENREYVSSNAIPQTLKDAIVSTEDRRFYSEALGIDPIRIAEAFVANISGSSSLGLQGGSTLTQQLVKLSVFSTKSSDQTLRRKAQEAWLALKVNHDYSKDQILEFYINKVYMSNGTYGMQTASQYYYGKNLKELSIAQQALLAGMPQSPTNYDPYTHPENAKKRRDTVLAAMLRNNKITRSQYNEAINTPITDGLVPESTHKSENTEDNIIDSYLKEVISEVHSKGLNPYTDGLKIHTNLDLDAQTTLYNIVNDDTTVQFPDDKMQAAVTMTDPNNGKVLAQIGGRKTGNVQLGLNRAVQNTRSNGSTMKPLMDYGPAIEYNDYSTAHMVDDSKYVYPGTNIQLYDWDHKYDGKMNIRTALVQSRNVPAVKTLADVGISKASQFLSGLGINLPDSEKVLSTGIGGNISTLQNAAAYNAFANGGTYYKPYYVSKIITSDGIEHNFKKDGNEAMKPATAYMITDMLKGVFNPGNTGEDAKIANLNEAGKTGTSDYSADEIAKNPALGQTGIAKDSSFVGYTQQRTIAVWTGYDNPTENGISYENQKVAGLIYKALMSHVSQNLSNLNWTKPDSVASYPIIKNSNPPIIAAVAGVNTTQELFVKSNLPKQRQSTGKSSSTNASSASRSNASNAASFFESNASMDSRAQSSASSSSTQNNEDNEQNQGSENNTNEQRTPDQRTVVTP